MRKKLLQLISTLLFFIPFSICAQIHQGEFAYGGNGVSEDNVGQCVIQTYDGGYLIAGSTNSDNKASPYTDFFVIKLDKNGIRVWSHSITCPNSTNSIAYSAIQSADSNYVVFGATQYWGNGGYDVLGVKFSRSGNLIWERTLGGSNDDFGYSVTQSVDSDYVMVGSTSSFGAGASDIYLAKYDTAGNTKWVKTIGSIKGETGYSVIKTKDNGFAITGLTWSYGVGGNIDEWVIKCDTGGNVKWTTTIGGTSGSTQGNAIIQTYDGGYAVAGYTSSYGAGANDVYVTKLDSSGKVKWAKTIGGASMDVGNSLVQTKDSGYLVAGSTFSFGAGGYDGYLVKLDKSGNLQWTKTFGGSNYEYINSIIKTKDGGYAMVGKTTSYGVIVGSGYNVYFIKLDSNYNDCMPTGTGGAISTGDTVSGGGSSTAHFLVSQNNGGYLDTITNTYSAVVCNVITAVADNMLSPQTPIFPNPFNQVATITFADPYKHYIEIYDAVGREIASFQCNGQQYLLSRRGLDAGMYFIKIFNGARIYQHSLKIKVN